MPARIVRVIDSRLDLYRGEWTQILHRLLRTFDHSPNVLVKVFSYFDRCILAKYRVAIQIPRELGLPVILPYGEACSSAVDFEISIVEVITSIREMKVKELAMTIFMAIPCKKMMNESSWIIWHLSRLNPKSQHVLRPLCSCDCFIF
jgi:hypothetical protein